MTRLSIDSRLATSLARELLAAAPLEHGAFCSLYSVQRGTESRLVLGTPLGTHEPWTTQEADLLTPSGRSISAAVSAAQSRGSGLAFVHTHPMSRRVPRLSSVDIETTRRLGEVFETLIDGPFASLVVAPGGWSGAIVADDSLIELEAVAEVGRDLRIHTPRQQEVDVELDDRQLRAFGPDVQRALRAMRVGVVGAGGVGSPATEILVRMGVGEIVLIDHDRLDTPSNARRVFGVGARDFQQFENPPLKSEVVAAAMNALDLGSYVRAVVGDVRDQAIQGELLHVDLILGGTDTHSSRAVLAQLCREALIPLIDVGARVGVRKDGSLDALAFERRVQLPGGPCLLCWGSLDPEQIRIELLPDAERAKLRSEGYIAGALDEPVPSLAALTVTAAGAATSAVLGLISGAFDVAPLGVRADSLSLDAYPLSVQTQDPDCVCRLWSREVDLDGEWFHSYVNEEAEDD